MSDADAGLINSAVVGVDYADPGTEPAPVADEPDKPPKPKKGTNKMSDNTPTDPPVPDPEPEPEDPAPA
jgi:hypothetical protein